MGPIYDEQGLEQGGVNSSDFYKIFGSEQLGTAQASGLGVSLGPIVVSGIGQADDTALISNNVHNLYYLLHLTKIFCSKYQVELCSEKTQFQMYYNKETKDLYEYTNFCSICKLSHQFDFRDSFIHHHHFRHFH